jgi:hypothetical protein
VEVARILLENGARDEWGDLFGTYARDYIRDDEIGVLFKKHGFSLKYSYETKSYEPGNSTTTKEIQPAQREIAISTSTNIKRHQTPTTDELSQGPSRAVSFKINKEQQLCLPPKTSTADKPHPGPSGFKRSRVSNRSTKDLPMLISITRTTTSRQPDANCYIIYDPTLRDDAKLPKITIFGFEPEYRWTESYPIEPHRPTNYTRPDLETSAPKIVYPMDSPNAYKFHLMHLNLEYSNRLKTANRSWYKRDLYEIYNWERNNLDNDLKKAQAALLRAAFQKRLSAMTRPGNIN